MTDDQSQAIRERVSFELPGFLERILKSFPGCDGAEARSIMEQALVNYVMVQSKDELTSLITSLIASANRFGDTSIHYVRLSECHLKAPLKVDYVTSHANEFRDLHAVELGWVGTN